MTVNRGGHRSARVLQEPSLSQLSGGFFVPAGQAGGFHLCSFLGLSM
jgi:hypothetical protein